MTQVDGVRVTAVLAADPDLHSLAGLAALFHRDLHQPPHAFLVDRLERVARQDLLLQVADDERALGVVAREAERGLRQVVGAEGEELRLLRDLARGQRGARDLDHGAELVGNANAGFLLDRFRDWLQLGVHRAQLGDRAGERDHDFRPRVDLALAQVGGRLHDRAHLHASDLGVEDRQAHAAQAQHRVGLVQLLDASQDLLPLGQSRRVFTGVLEMRRLADQLLEAGQELVERRVDEPDDHRQARHLLEDPFEVATLDGQELGELLLALLGRGGHDHGLHDRQPVLLHEHVLRAAQTHALRAVFPRLRSVARIVRVRPHLETADLVGPAQDCARGRVLVQRAGLDRGHVPDVDVAGRAVDRDLVAFLDGGAVGREPALPHVDVDRARAHDAWSAHATRDKRGVRSGPTCLGEDALRLDHAVHVVRVGLDADEDHRLALLAPLHGRVRVEHGSSGSSAR